MNSLLSNNNQLGSTRSKLMPNIDDTFRDSLEGSRITVSKESILLPDSLNNTQILSNNPEPNRKENSKKMINDIKNEEEMTKKISYKYISNYPTPNINIEVKEKASKFFWFAAYDKLMNEKKITKIIKFYTGKEPTTEIKSKVMTIKDFELIIKKNMFFIQKKKSGYIFVKIFYLDINTINMIFNYLNRIECSIPQDIFVFNNSLGNYSKINHKNFQINYNCITCLGSYLNVCIYCFTNFEYVSSTYNVSVSSSKVFDFQIKKRKIYKLVKYLTELFNSYTTDFFLNYCLTSLEGSSANVNGKIMEIKKYTYNQIERKNHKPSDLYEEKEDILNPKFIQNDLTESTIHNYENNKNQINNNEISITNDKIEDFTENNHNVNNNNTSNIQTHKNIKSSNALNVRQRLESIKNSAKTSNNKFNPYNSSKVSMVKFNKSFKNSKTVNRKASKPNTNTSTNNIVNSNTIKKISPSISNTYFSHKPKICSNTNFSSNIGSRINEANSLSYLNNETNKNIITRQRNTCNTAFGGVKNYSFKNNNTFTQTLGSNITDKFEGISKRNSGVFVVGRQSKNEADFMDDDSSIQTKREKVHIKTEKDFVTPVKKKIPNYYS